MRVTTNCIEINIPIQYRILLESRVAQLATIIGLDFTMVFSPDAAECAPSWSVRPPPETLTMPSGTRQTVLAMYTNLSSVKTTPGPGRL
jgi:hypothetical protein